MAIAIDSVNECYPTPPVWDLEFPRKFNLTNDLTKTTYTQERAKGEIIKVKGHVLDANCIPVSGAVVQLWQPNFLGVYQYHEDEEEFDKYDQNFAGTGTATTNNIGEFEFITVMPGTLDQDAPALNFRIKHKDFDQFETKIFFENHAINEYDHIYVKHNLFERKALTAIFEDPDIALKPSKYYTYIVNIVMSKKSAYRKY